MGRAGLEPAAFHSGGFTVRWDHQLPIPTHKRHLITVLCRLANLVHFLFPALGYPPLTDLWDARMVEMFSNNPILLKVITGSYSLLSQTRYGLQRVLLSPTAVFLVLPEGLKPSTLSLGRICADSIAPWKHLNKSREVNFILTRNNFEIGTSICDIVARVGLEPTRPIRGIRA